MVLNCFMAASVLVVVKSATPGLDLSLLISCYNLLAFVIVAVLSIIRKYNIHTKVIYLHFIRSLLGVIAYFLYFHALSITSMANVITLGYTDAILTCFFAYMFLNEKMSKVEVLNLCLTFIGALIIIKPNFDIMNIGAILAGMASILWALSNILIKVISKDDDAFVQLFYSNFFIGIISGILFIVFGDMSKIDTALENYNWILILAVISSIQAFSLFKSLSLATAAVVMPFFIVSVIFVHIYGYFFFGEVQDYNEIIGTLLIVSVSIWQLFRIS